MFNFLKKKKKPEMTPEEKKTAREKREACMNEAQKKWEAELMDMAHEAAHDMAHFEALMDNARCPADRYEAMKLRPMMKNATLKLPINGPDGKPARDEHGELILYKYRDASCEGAKKYPELYFFIPLVADPGYCKIYEFLPPDKVPKYPEDKYPDFPEWMLEDMEKSIEAIERIIDEKGVNAAAKDAASLKIEGVHREITHVTAKYFFGGFGMKDLKETPENKAKYIELMLRFKEYMAYKSEMEKSVAMQRVLHQYIMEQKAETDPELKESLEVLAADAAEKGHPFVVADYMEAEPKEGGDIKE